MKKLEKKFIFSLCIIFLGVFCLNSVFSQSNDFLTEVIATDSITYGQVAYLTMCDLSFIEETASESDAISALEENFPKVVSTLSIQKTSQELSAKQLSYICCSVYNIKSSLMFMIFQNPRYAFRQIKSLGYFASNENEKSFVSGRKAMMIIADCSEKARMSK